MYMLFGIFLMSMIIGTAIYMSRSHWIPLLPDVVIDRLYGIGNAAYSRLPQTFVGDAESGFHSSNFNLADNIAGEDTRAGLDGRTKLEIQRIMKSRRVDFDEARRIHMQAGFKKGGIGIDGLPNDPKLVTFGGR